MEDDIDFEDGIRQGRDDKKAKQSGRCIDILSKVGISDLGLLVPDVSLQPPNLSRHAIPADLKLRFLTGPGDDQILVLPVDITHFCHVLQGILRYVLREPFSDQRQTGHWMQRDVWL
jgi:hypothetical protein